MVDRPIVFYIDRARMTPITVLAVDDHPLLREGITAVLGNQPDLLVVGEASNGVEAVERCRALTPDIVLMDLEMPDMSGIEAIAAIRAAVPSTHIIVLTAHGSDAQILGALNAGAVGYLLKDGLRKELVDTIRRVHAGRRGVSPAVALKLVESQLADALTERELEILVRVAAGNSNKIVGDTLSIAEETVKSHMRSILSKLGANDRTHAVTIAIKRGLISI
jgi:DNA-binding NarL/FixJ family response regulator